jgi:4-aminobutyrate aminotransferase / (S)-3-amino-2-methylpropionate transaminase / 5-aminovalerate transaminase
MDLRDAAGEILGTTSYGGNPIACAHAVYTVDRIRRMQLLNRIQACESTYAPVLAENVERVASVLRSEWHGLLFGFEMASAEIARQAARRAADAGLLVSQLGPVIRCSPPLNIADDLFECGLTALLEAVLLSV